ncbi:MAG: right-handed parallel beta-helix repeat-containing protein [Pseudomonadota bacterium]
MLKSSLSLNITLAIALLVPALRASTADTLPDSPVYLGEIKRNEKGELVAVPIPVAAPPKVTVVDEVIVPVAEEIKVIRVGPAQPLHTIGAAAAIAKNGDTVEIEAGDYVGDVAIWKQDRLTIRGVDGRPRLIANGKSAEGKAIWIIRGGHITIENIVFTGAQVSDRNGAGIRFERGNLVIRNCAFLDNENGILAGSGGESLEIENSEFGRNGAGDGRSHNLYVNAIKSLKVTGSYFHHANVGHLLKSRAAENIIMYNRLSDETGQASYELEFPDGGYAYVVGNVIQQSPNTENPTIIAFGMEGYKWPASQLYLTFNTIVNDLPGRGTFLNVKPGAQKVISMNNLLVGKGDWYIEGQRITKNVSSDKPYVDATASSSASAIIVRNNFNTDGSAFAQASSYDYRVKKSALPRIKAVSMQPANGFLLEPQREYVSPTGSQALIGSPAIPGALQSRVLHP